MGEWLAIDPMVMSGLQNQSEISLSCRKKKILKISRNN
jgi:hypothetical protein